MFAANVVAARQRLSSAAAKSPPSSRKPRQAAGWRGLSVDLITNPEVTPSPPAAARTQLTEAVEEEVGAEDRLDGSIVRAVWKLSRLENATLRVIW